MDGYAAMVSRASFAYTTIPLGDTPYWATNGPGGRQCWISVAGDDKVAVLDYKTAALITYVAVGDHPQRIRLGELSTALLQ
jgi:hypothetical protein